MDDTRIDRDHPGDGAALEALIDRNSLATVLETIAQICGLKSEHIAANWQDRETAGAWTSAGVAVDRACQIAAKVGL